MIIELKHCENWEMPEGFKTTEADGYTIPVYKELGAARYYKKIDWNTGVVVKISGKLKRIRYSSDTLTSEDYPFKGVLTIEDTNEPETDYEDYLDYYQLKMFGQPEWVQSEIYPSANAKCLFTYESGWGDCGNEIVFIEEENGNITRGWFEAACC